MGTMPVFETLQKLAYQNMVPCSVNPWEDEVLVPLSILLAEMCEFGSLLSALGVSIGAEVLGLESFLAQPIEFPTKHLQAIRNANQILVRFSTRFALRENAVRELIKNGESATVEIKSTARWDVKLNQPGKHIERIIVKTVAAFLNTKGGTLVIGVEDNGSVYGLVEDYKLSGNKGRDGFELWLMQTLLKDFGKDAAGQIAIAFHE